MRGLMIALAAAAVTAAAMSTVRGEESLRLAQSSTVTNCMMSCNAQAASCQTNCVVPGVPPTNAATTTSNATASTACTLNCSTQQLTCQSSCALQSPSR
jgi:hypothetical protein